MADLKLQVSRTIDVVPSDTINIPQPWTEAVSGTSDTASGGAFLKDTTATFQSDGILVGAVVYETAGTKAVATVLSVDSDTQLTLSADIFPLGTETYTIYNKTTDDCSWYVGVSGNISAVTSGGDTVTLLAVPVGWQPLQIKRINSTGTTATDIVAAW